MIGAKQVIKDLKKLANPTKAKLLQRFFKTKPGQYGAGDIFLGIMVPTQRIVAKKYANSLSLKEVEKLLHSKFHEHRLVALLILVDKFSQATAKEQAQIYKLYLKNYKFINNWDLVDLSAHRIVGPYLADKSKDILFKLAASKNLWQRRIAVLSSFYFIKQNQPQINLKLAVKLLKDRHDLIHKAVGWMLREVGKNSGQKTLTDFLDKYSSQMPRTMLRYAIERLPEKLRKYYLAR